MVAAAPLLTTAATTAGATAAGTAATTAAVGGFGGSLIAAAPAITAATTGTSFLGTLGTLASIASIGSTLYGAYDAYQGSNYEAQQYTQQVDFEQTRAAQDEANRQRKLTQILGSQMALAAGRGMKIGSGTDLAIAKFSEEEAQRESDIAAFDSRQSQINAMSRAQQASKRGRASLVSGVVDAGVRGYDTYTKFQERQRTINK